jgi:hypothetical protein
VLLVERIDQAGVDQVSPIRLLGAHAPILLVNHVEASGRGCRSGADQGTDGGIGDPTALAETSWVPGVVTDNKDDVYSEFQDAVNLTERQLEDWLATDESKSVGQSSGGESTGHRSGRQIVRILGKKKADLTDDDYDHMHKVLGYIKRHSAQRPDGDVEETPWRYSLMNWGHDPLKR